MRFHIKHFYYLELTRCHFMYYIYFMRGLRHLKIVMSQYVSVFQVDL